MLDGLGRPIESGGHPLPAPLHEGLPPIGSSPRTIRIGDDPCFDLHFEPLADGGSIHDPAALVYHRQGGLCGSDPIGALIGLHGLSRSEARLAWALCEGLSIREAADMIGLSIETARNYSKRIYAKVGASGQADLVRILLGGIAALV
jgi:DNA-binding CsgD family transcriptional regulator